MIRKITFFTLLTVMPMVFGGEIKMSLANFKGVEFIGNYKVQLIQSDSNYIHIINGDVIKVADNDINVMVANNILKMSIKQDLYTEKDISVRLYYQSIETVVGKRGVKIEGDTLLHNDNITIEASTGAKINIGVKTKLVSASINSGGSIRVRGLAESAEYSVNTGGTIAGSFLDVKAVKANIRLGGEIILNATETLEIDIRAGGTVSHRGNPIIKSQSVKLGGTIENLEKINNGKY